MTPSQKNHPSFYAFKDTKDFQTFLQTKEWKDGEIDYITVTGIVYTMHEYDINGKSVTWANQKHQSMIEAETSNRYKNGYKDAIVSESKPFYLRNDITYYE